MQISEKYNLRRLAQDIYASGVNLAESRDDWLTLMFSLAGGGEAMLESFLLLASQGSTYKEKESRREFRKAMRKTNDSNLAWFLKRAKELGYNLNDYTGTPPGLPSKGRGSESYQRRAQTTCFLQAMHPDQNNNSKMIHTIPQEYLQKCRSDASTFVQSLVSAHILTAGQAARAAALYHLGAMRDGSVIYWQIDEQGRLRDGKVMQYGPDCHRLKDRGAQWMGWLMRYKFRGADGKPLLPMEWQATQCLFGQHLISEELGVRSEEYFAAPSSSRNVANNSSLLTPNSSLICIVEAEKTAVILSQLQPDKLWLAAGGEQQLNLDKLAPLRGRKVILFPDTDPDGHTFAAWQHIANEARRQLSLNVSVSSLLEDFASPDQKLRKIDIADFLIENREENPYSPALQSMIEDNPAMQDFIDTFGLVEINTRQQ